MLVLWALLSTSLCALVLPFYQRQITDYTCGDATLSMLLSTTGPAVSQRTAIRVLRTTNSTGTLLADLVRGAEFSSLSAPQRGVFSPDFTGNRHESNDNNNNNNDFFGWTGRASGLVAFGGAGGGVCWVDGVERLVALGLPVAVLQWWSGKRDADDGGHYRLVVGAGGGRVTVMDPWDRDGFPRVPELLESRFCDLWNYTDKDAKGNLHGAFSGMYASPLVVNISVAMGAAGGTVTALVSVPCVAPLCTAASAKTVTGVRAVLSLPYGLSLEKGVAVEQVSQADLAIPGEPLRFSWAVASADPVVGGAVKVTAVGRVAGTVPDREGWFPSLRNYSAYNFSDAVAGSGRWTPGRPGPGSTTNSKNKTTIIVLAVALSVSLVFSALLALARRGARSEERQKGEFELLR
jgi:hypothetical protein